MEKCGKRLLFSENNSKKGVWQGCFSIIREAFLGTADTWIVPCRRRLLYGKRNLYDAGNAGFRTAL